MAVSVGFISLGCAKNLVDSQLLAGYLKAGKIELAYAPEVADIILINTCAFIEPAREEAAESILSACAYKQEGKCQAVIVAGCMVARYREKLLDAFPDVDAFIGIDDYEKIASVVKKLEEGKRCGLVARKGAARKLYNPIYPTLLFTGAPYAYLKVADGCDHRCAYCAIPQIRGSFRSRSMESLLKETRDMVSAGVKEINLIAQDVLRYGYDLTPDRKPLLPALLREIEKIDGEFWYRLLYGYPSQLTDEVIDILKHSKHACHYLDLPIQHSHPDILRAMNRPAAVAATANLTERLRAAIPDITVRTTCLVGFPGETEEHFNHLLDHIKREKFDCLGVFPYSPEEGTAAFDMDDIPPVEVADERCEKIMKVQKKIVAERRKALVGREEKALLLQKKGKAWIARLPCQAPEADGITRVSGVSPDAQPGDFVEVKITGGRGYDLNAEVIEQPANR